MKNTQHNCVFWHWWRWAELNRRVAFRFRSFLRIYTIFNLFAKQPVGRQPAQKPAKCLRCAVGGTRRTFIAFFDARFPLRDKTGTDSRFN